MRSIEVVALAFVVSTLGSACALPASEEADRFREGLPLQQEVALRVPGGASATNAARPRSAGLRIATGTGGGETARYYQLTRDLTGAVDFGTAVILGGVWSIVHSAPTTLEPKKAVWGPGAGNALEPAVWRFTVHEIGDAEYDYVLEGQPRGGGAWLTVMKGHGYGKSRSEHKQGWFEVDNDAYKALEPTRGKDEGTTKVTYDLRQIPATIAVELRPEASKGWADVKVTHAQAGAGSVEITSLGDLDESKATALEDIHLVSRWTSDGSGRADVSMKNGDLPFTVDATECWSASFARVYYKDTVDFEPQTGAPGVCAFTGSPAP
ncbi:MAG: hypothetical protein KF782_29365 [Labilithrix sp.]|nr:hypothetical protein [Labilithrix sp.]